MSGQHEIQSDLPPAAVPGWFVPVFRRAERVRPIVIADLVRHQWAWLLLTPLLFLLGAVAYVLVAPRIYESSVLLAPAEDDQAGGLLGSLSGQLRSVAPLLGADIGVGSQIKERALAVMASRAFTDRFLREHQMLPILFADRWDSKRKVWTKKVPSADDAFEEFDRRVRFISEDRKSGFVRVAMRARDPALAAQWAETFVVRLNEHMRAKASEEARKNLEFLNRELARTPILGVQQSLYRLIETQVRNQMLASVREEYAFRVVDSPVVPAPNRFVSPHRALVLSLSLVAGLLLALGIALARELLSSPKL